LNPQNKQVSSPVALITGAARRIGAAIAQHLHQAGFRTVIHCHQSHQEAIDLSDSLNHLRAHSAKILCADLLGSSAAHYLINETVAWGGRLDVLVNNASLFSRQSEHWDAMFNLNVKAPFLLSHAARVHLVDTRGVIINITDTHTNKPLKGYCVYCQTKAALSMQTRALACEFAPSVRVNAVAPGAILWPEEDNALSEESQQAIINKTPLKQHGHPIFIAQAVLSLIENTFITGQTLCVDGGRVIS
jgi:pteridine reductase